MNNSIKTISPEEIEEFLKDLKSGDICQIVSRKYEHNSVKHIDNPWVLNISQNKWLSPKNSIVLVMDETSVKPTWSRALSRMPIPTFSLPYIKPPPWTQKDWSKWHSSFIKVLYEDQICLIHAGWLEKHK